MRPSWTKRVSSTFAPVSLFRSSSSSARLHTHAALSIARFLNVCLKSPSARPSSASERIKAVACRCNAVLGW